MKTNNLTWVIEKDLFPEYEAILVEEIKKSGHSAILLDYDRQNFNLKKWTEHHIDNGMPVIFYGSLQVGQQFNKLSYYPGTYLTPEQYLTYNYYHYYGYNLLNNDYVLYPLNDIKNKLNNIIYHFKLNQSQKLFIRPIDGIKTFAGQLLPLSNFIQEFDILCNSYGGLDMNTLCLLSTEKEIVEEYRFVIINNELVTGSMYFDENNIGSFKPYFNKEVNITSRENEELVLFVLAQKNKYQPDKAFTMDICKLKDERYKIMEINSLTSAALYGVNYSKVVEKLNELVLEDYNDVY
jgi:hypothetical protein